MNNLSQYTTVQGMMENILDTINKIECHLGNPVDMYYPYKMDELWHDFDAKDLKLMKRNYIFFHTLLDEIYCGFLPNLYECDCHPIKTNDLCEKCKTILGE